jgi:hypothetical protein
MAIALDKASMQSGMAFKARRRAYSLDDSILDRMLDSRVLGRNTLAIVFSR